MATKIIKEKNVRKIFDGQQLTPEAIKVLDNIIHRELVLFKAKTSKYGRITDETVLFLYGDSEESEI